MINPQMEFIKVTLENIKETIKKWYNPNKYHYVTINATDTGKDITIDWIFSDLKEKNKIYIFRAENIDYEDFIPSIKNIVKISWLAEFELSDLFGLNVQDAPKGVFLENDSIKAPLRKETKWEK